MNDTFLSLFIGGAAATETTDGEAEDELMLLLQLLDKKEEAETEGEGLAELLGVGLRGSGAMRWLANSIKNPSLSA